VRCGCGAVPATSSAEQVLSGRWPIIEWTRWLALNAWLSQVQSELRMFVKDSDLNVNRESCSVTLFGYNWRPFWTLATIHLVSHRPTGSTPTTPRSTDRAVWIRVTQASDVSPDRDSRVLLFSQFSCCPRRDHLCMSLEQSRQSVKRASNSLSVSRWWAAQTTIGCRFLPIFNAQAELGEAARTSRGALLMSRVHVQIQMRSLGSGEMPFRSAISARRVCNSVVSDSRSSGDWFKPLNRCCGVCYGDCLSQLQPCQRGCKLWNGFGRIGWSHMHPRGDPLRFLVCSVRVPLRSRLGCHRGAGRPDGLKIWAKQRCWDWRNVWCRRIGVVSGYVLLWEFYWNNAVETGRDHRVKRLSIGGWERLADSHHGGERLDGVLTSRCNRDVITQYRPHKCFAEVSIGLCNRITGSEPNIGADERSRFGVITVPNEMCPCRCLTAKRDNDVPTLITDVSKQRRCGYRCHGSVPNMEPQPVSVGFGGRPNALQVATQSLHRQCVLHALASAFSLVGHGSADRRRARLSAHLPVAYAFRRRCDSYL